MFESRRPSSMELSQKRPKSPTPDELLSMLATLCSYEARFGPNHPYTLILTTHLGGAYWRAGRSDRARVLLERAVRDLARYVGRDCDSRLQAMVALRHLYSSECDFERADAIRRELWACQAAVETNEEGVNCGYSPPGKFIFHS
jgi:hypothetical protein